MLAALGSAEGDLLVGARVLNTAAFAVSVLLTGWLILHGTRSLPAASIGSLLVLLSPEVVSLAGWVMADAVFISLMIASLLALACYLREDNRKALVVGALLAGVAVLFRYVGVSLVLTGVLGILWLRPRGRGRVIADPAWFLALALMPGVLLLARNFMVAGTPANRILAMPSVDLSIVGRYTDTVASWLVPAPWAAALRVRWKMLLLALGLGFPPALLLFTSRKRDAPAEGHGAPLRQVAAPEGEPRDLEEGFRDDRRAELRPPLDAVPKEDHHLDGHHAHRVG
jgi:hypothetical protein